MIWEHSHHATGEKIESPTTIVDRDAEHHLLHFVYLCVIMKFSILMDFESEVVANTHDFSSH